MSSNRQPTIRTNRAPLSGPRSWALGAVLCLLAAVVAPVSAQRAPRPTPARDTSFGNISVLGGGGSSVQRGEVPEHSTLGVALGLDFLKPRLIATGQFRAKFLTQEEVRDPTFICATQDCGPTHRLGLQADAYFDLWKLGPVGLGVSGGMLAFRGTLSTMVVQHPGFEQGLTAFSLGPSLSVRGQEIYGAVAPVWNKKFEQTLGDDRFSAGGFGLTGVIRFTRGRFGVYGDGRAFFHAQSDLAQSDTDEIYVPPPALRSSVRADDAVMADADVRLRFQVSATSYVNLGVYFELSRSSLVFVPTGLTVPREFRDRGVSLSFEFLQY